LVNVNDVITNEVAAVVSEWGIQIERVTLTDLGNITTYRIMSDSNKPILHINTNEQ